MITTSSTAIVDYTTPHEIEEPLGVRMPSSEDPRRPFAPCADNRKGRLGVQTKAGWQNVRMMRLLDRLALKFNEAGIPLMALKGAALHLTLYDRPDARPMSDLDLMIHSQDLDRAFAVLEAAGGLRGESSVREDFFPRFHYEMEYSIGTIFPVKVDLHVRPFRPLRYSQTVPPDAFWIDAWRVWLGDGEVPHPCAEDMLIHLCVHAAIHGACRPMWLRDIRLWTEKYGASIHWDRFLEKVRCWQLTHPVRCAIEQVEKTEGKSLPREVAAKLGAERAGWRDRLALWQAPRDAAHPVAHVAVNTICTPGLRFAGSYLWAFIVPDESYMAEWYGRRHRGWLFIAHLLRWLGPLVRLLPFLQPRQSRTELRASPIHGVGVFATSNVEIGEVIAYWFGRLVDRNGMYVIQHTNQAGKQVRHELTGKLKHLNHSCSPNARLLGFQLVALRPILKGHEITIDYGSGACDCKSRIRLAPGDDTDKTGLGPSNGRNPS